jgi:glycosyltransferase involved in cell wall biosynthesis
VVKTSELVTVGIPTYNNPEGLRNTLNNIINQTYHNLEILISDNCSPNTDVQEVCRDFVLKDPRVRYYRHDTNTGLANNFHSVLQKATGDYFVWVADDDNHNPGFISTLVTAIESGNAIGAMCSTKRIDENGRFIDIVRFNTGGVSVLGLSRLELTFFFHGVFRTGELKKYINTSSSIFGLDFIKVYEMLLSSKLVWVDQVLFTKGYDRKKNDAVYKSDRLCWVKLAYRFPVYLLTSEYIVPEKKVLIVPITVMFWIWIGKLYAGHIVYLITGKPRI